MELENEGPIMEITYDKADLEDESEGSLNGSVESSSIESAQENLDEKLQDLIQSQQADLDIMMKNPGSLQRIDMFLLNYLNPKLKPVLQANSKISSPLISSI